MFTSARKRRHSGWPLLTMFKLCAHACIRIRMWRSGQNKRVRISRNIQTQNCVCAVYCNRKMNMHKRKRNTCMRMSVCALAHARLYNLLLHSVSCSPSRGKVRKEWRFLLSFREPVINAKRKQKQACISIGLLHSPLLRSEQCGHRSCQCTAYVS